MATIALDLQRPSPTRLRRHSDGISSFPTLSLSHLSQSTLSSASTASDESAPPSVIFSSNAPSPSSSLASSPLLDAKRTGFPFSSAAVPPLSLSPPIAANATPLPSPSHTAPVPAQPTPTELAVYASNVIRNEAYALLALAARLAPAAHPLIDDEGSYLPHYSPASDAASTSGSDEDLDGRSSGSDLGAETRTNQAFRQVVDLIRSMPPHGKVLVSGIGKSGIVARKMVATFCSLGIQSAFLHPVEALHGDLGIVCSCDPFSPCDTLLLISHSGATAELMRLLPIIRPRVRSLVAVTRDPDSVLAKSCHGWLDAGTGVYPSSLPKGTTDEADSTLPAPTSSVVSALAIGDALALTLSRLRIGWDKGGKERRQEFFHCHPGGQLGIQLGREGRGVDVPASPPSAPIIPVTAPTPTPASTSHTLVQSLVA